MEYYTLSPSQLTAAIRLIIAQTATNMTQNAKRFLIAKNVQDAHFQNMFFDNVEQIHDEFEALQNAGEQGQAKAVTTLGTVDSAD